MLELTVYGQLHAIIEDIVKDKVDVMNLIGIGLVNVLLLHLAIGYIEESDYIVSGQILVDAQLKTVIFLHAAIAHEDKGTKVLDDILELGILIDKSYLSTAFSKRLGDAALIEMDTLHQVGHIEVVAPRVEVLIGAYANAPSFSYRCRDVGVHRLTAKMIDRVVHFTLKPIASHFRLAIYAIGNDSIFQHHILRTHGLH